MLVERVVTGAIAPILPGLPRAVLRADPLPGPMRSRRPLPLAAVPVPRACPIGYGMSAVDDRGRVSDRILTEVLGWTAGTTLSAVAAPDGLIVVRPDSEGRLRVTPGGSFRLPAATRHRGRLRAGDRILLVADPERGELRLFPPATLDVLLGHLLGNRDSEDQR